MTYFKGIDILAMSMLNSDLYTCSANGWVKAILLSLVFSQILIVIDHSAGLPLSTVLQLGKPIKALLFRLS